MNDILPPKRPLSSAPNRPVRTVAPRPAQAPTPVKSPRQTSPPILLEKPDAPLLIETPKKSRKKRIVLWLIGILVVIATLAASVVWWYQSALQPVTNQSADKVAVEIASGSSPTQIGQLLEEKKLIRSSFAFDIYTRLSKTQAKLRAGTYSLSPDQSTQQIVSQLTSGHVDQFSITFLPGATLAENRAGLIKAGFDAGEVDAALSETYDHPLFAGKPESADLEGYIYGETYQFDADATVEEVLKRTFNHFYSTITENNLVEGFKKQNLNLYQGITLASIIQREVPHSEDQKQVAQVFFTRLAMGMQLGSDVTYQYAAKKMGVSPTPNLESPYNTRKYAGLPPGPIATPGLTALLAVASPADGDYVYFLSGDDDITYFGRTEAEHEENIKNHCQTKCLIL